MAKQNKSPVKSGRGERYQNGVPQTLVERNLAAMSPKAAEQFVPSGTEAVRLRYKMGGGC